MLEGAECALRILKNVYSSLNIYHAAFVVASIAEEDEFDATLIQGLIKNDYPLMFFDRESPFLFKARMIVVALEDLPHLTPDLHLFTLMIISDDDIFKQLISDPLYQSLTVLNISCYRR
jgi:hypothetical protein